MVLVRNLNTKCASATLESPGFEGNASDFKKRVEVLNFLSAYPQFPWCLVGGHGLLSSSHLGCGQQELPCPLHADVQELCSGLQAKSCNQSEPIISITFFNTVTVKI
eukprot:TRINITY_DN2406_c0_g1_i3.p1 TRINITY_DN2406_c0_g1~~TRINITY_DN2406_c0_g1_i3.p1  ORF type:complete len:107 (-),score=8.40 TRINITY_DN2406_c0_g1_i3:126-446(-)